MQTANLMSLCFALGGRSVAIVATSWLGRHEATVSLSLQTRRIELTTSPAFIINKVQWLRATGVQASLRLSTDRMLFVQLLQVRRQCQNQRLRN